MRILKPNKSKLIEIKSSLVSNITQLQTVKNGILPSNYQ